LHPKRTARRVVLEHQLRFCLRSTELSIMRAGLQKKALFLARALKSVQLDYCKMTALQFSCRLNTNVDSASADCQLYSAHNFHLESEFVKTATSTSTCTLVLHCTASSRFQFFLKACFRPSNGSLVKPSVSFHVLFRWNSDLN
jgi:hypothetical protein